MLLQIVIVILVAPLFVITVIQKPKSFKLYPEDESLANATNLPTFALDNLKRVLDHIYESPEFFPFTLSIVSWSSQPDIVNLVSRYIAGNPTNAYQMETTNSSVKGTWLNRADLTWIFIMEDPCTLNAFVKWQRDTWKAKNQYIIVYTNYNRLVIWREIFTVLWRTYNVYRIIVTSIQEEFGCLYTYSPIERIRKEYGVVRKIYLPSFVRRDYALGERRVRGASRKAGVDFVLTLTHETKLFENFQNFKNFPVRVTVFNSLMMHIERRGNGTKFSGLDAIVMKHLEQGLRASFQIIALSYQRHEDPFHESLRMLENGDTEIVITAFFAKTYSGYSRYEFTSGVYEDQLCFIAPAVGIIPKSYMPFQPFQADLWLLLVASNLLTTTLWFLIKHSFNAFHTRKSDDGYQEKCPFKETNALLRFCNSTNMKNASSRNDFLAPRSNNETFKSVVTKENPDLHFSRPRNIHRHVIALFDLLILSCYPLQGANSASQKILLMSTLFFGLIITGLYQSGLVSNLSEPSHYPELNTMEDVANSNLTIVTKYSNLKRDTFAVDTPLGKRLKEKVKVLKSNEKTNNLVAYGREVIALGRYSAQKLENLSVYYDMDGNELLHIVDECPASYILSYVVSLYSPWLERIDNLLLRMHEAGLVDWWYRSLLEKVQADEQRRKTAKSARRIKLTLEHYFLAFLGLFVGLLCCTIVFLAELYYAKSMNGWT